MNADPSYLIVNADDFGYFRGVSEGIVDAHLRGIVSATGILANGPALTRDIDLLENSPTLDVGVHLNLTDGLPVAVGMRQRLKRYGGSFPGKLGFVKAYLSGQVKQRHVELEWRSQIERCLHAGLTLSFLNSHEHIHMLPPLFSLAQDLAIEYRIPYLRLSSPERVSIFSAGVFLRDLTLKALGVVNLCRLRMNVPLFRGMGASGKLSEDYLGEVLDSLQPNRVYELMCHPGLGRPSDVGRKDLADYHDWELELRTLCNDGLVSRLAETNVKTIGYRDLAGLGASALLRGPVFGTAP